MFHEYDNKLKIEKELKGSNSDSADDSDALNDGYSTFSWNIISDECENKSSINEYSYLEWGFTSEAFKVELKNIPKFASYTCVRKFVQNKCKVTPKKIKILGKRKKYAFLSFNSEKEREIVLNTLQGINWKDCEIYAIKANPAKDPLIKCKSSTIKPLDDFDDDSKSDSERINDKVCPLWRKQYEQQLEEKKNKNWKFIKKLLTIIAKINISSGVKQEALEEWASKMKEKHKACCALDPIVSSPILNGYRNKCEFSIGPENIVGFRLGLYREGSLKVIAPPNNCPIVSDRMRSVVNLFQKFLNESELIVFNKETNKGYWKQLTVRTSKDSIMAIISLDSQDMNDEAINNLKEKTANFFKNHQHDILINSVYLCISKRHDNRIVDSNNLILGDEFIYDEMRNGDLIYKFRISPFAFFQVNTAAAELCYQEISRLAELTKETIILDICCGIGTIGIYLSHYVKHVFAIECNKDAIEDAKYNAYINNITKIDFYCSKAEDCINTIWNHAEIEYKDSPIVAIIDPPRAGLHSNFVKFLRSKEKLTKLVYVSCEPYFAQKNLIDFARPTSKKSKGMPFVPIRCVPVDLFPHTIHCELILLLERLKTNSNGEIIE